MELFGNAPSCNDGDDAASSEAAEELASRTIARDVATLIAGESSRSRFGREQIAVSVFDEDGKIIAKIWTRSEYDPGRRLELWHLAPAAVEQFIVPLGDEAWQRRKSGSPVVR